MQGDVQKARAVAEERQRKARDAVMTHREHVSLENLFTSIEAGRVRELQLIVKGDVRGTIDAFRRSVPGQPGRRQSRLPP